MRHVAAAVSIGLMAAAAVAAQSPPSPPPPDAAAKAAAGHEALRTGEYMKADRLLRSVALNPNGSVRDEGEYGSWTQIHPMLTGEPPVGGWYPAKGTPPAADPKDLAALAAAIPHDAIAEIVRRAAATRIIILNEAHDSPRDRAFALEVARALRPLGYAWLAAETFNNAADWGGRPSITDMLLRDGFVRQGTGYYTTDPVFAAYLREALRLGYRPVSYEQTEKQGLAEPGNGIVRREEAEARNLQAFLVAHPGAKLLIHVGYHHLAEAPIGVERNEWMAARLKRKTGIDPLTVDQTDLTDASAKVAPLYAAAAARIDRPSVFFAGDRPLVLGGLAGAVDLQVVHPARSYRNGRPAWLSSLGGHPVPIPADLLPAHGERLVQAFAADAPADAVPLDQVLVRAGTPAPMLMVPAGKLRFAVQDPPAPAT